MSGSTTSATFVALMPSLNSSSQWTMISGSSSTGAGMLGRKYTVGHIREEHENLQEILNQIAKTFNSNIGRFQDNQDVQARLFNDIGQLNIEYLGRKRDEIPSKEFMEKEKIQNRNDLNKYKNICAEVEDFVLNLFSAVSRLKHAPNPQHPGSETLIEERQRLHEESDAMHRQAKLKYYGPAKALCDKMYKTNQGLETEVLLHKKIYRDNHGEYLVFKGVRALSTSLSYFWGAPGTQTPVKTTPPEDQTTTPALQTTTLPQVQTSVTLHVETTTPSTEEITTTPQQTIERTTTPVETFPTETPAPTDTFPRRTMSPPPSIASPDSPSPKALSSNNKTSYSDVLKGKNPGGGRSPYLADDEISTGLKNRIPRGGSATNLYRSKGADGPVPLRPMHRREVSKTSEAPKTKEKEGAIEV